MVKRKKNHRPKHDSINKLGGNAQTRTEHCKLEANVREWVLLTLPLTDVEHQSKLQSTFYKTAQILPNRGGKSFWRQRLFQTIYRGPVRPSTHHPVCDHVGIKC